jgi:hypothetical protein
VWSGRVSDSRAFAGTCGCETGESMRDETQKDGTQLTGKTVICEGEPARYYANNTEVAITSFDISIKFALIDRSDSEHLYLKDQAIVAMSLHHAKAVTDILQRHIAEFERIHGPLSISSSDR